MKSRIKRIFPALLCAFSAVFPYCLAGPLDIWVGNRTEFRFALPDFFGWTTLIFFGLWAVLTLVLLAVPDKVYPILFGLMAGFGIMSCFQALFLNLGVRSLLWDDVGFHRMPTWYGKVNALLWLLVEVGCVIGAIKMKKHETVRLIAVLALITVGGMQLVGCASLLPTILSTDTEGVTSSEPADGTVEDSASEGDTAADKDEAACMYLTTAGLNTVAPGKNIVIFVLDRFDTNYYDELIEKDPEMFDFLTGFTAYPDNISLYSRTYPAIASMVTGMRNDFSGTAEDYFAKAYGTSDFLKTLKQNDYAVRVYTADYYGYRDAAALAGMIDNVNTSDGYMVTKPAKLVGNMLFLSIYRYAPNVVKNRMSLSTNDFDDIGIYDEVPMYKMDDAAVFRLVEEGLTEDDAYGENAYTLIHLNGLHPPHGMDENGNAVSGGSMTAAAHGCFKLIKNYLNEMKRLGVYEDATVIITGDHPSPVDDYAEPTQTRLTALFVKEAGRAEEPFRVSSAQVSQENNLLGTLVKSAGLKTDRDWGLAYSEVPEGVDIERHHLFEFTYESNTSAIMDFRVMGSGRDFANWEKVSQTDIGWLYK